MKLAMSLLLFDGVLLLICIERVPPCWKVCIEFWIGRLVGLQLPCDVAFQLLLLVLVA